MNNSSDKQSKYNNSKMLRYAAAALSVVSFYTTQNGIYQKLTDSLWQSILISFGVQAILLVLGVWFIPTWLELRKKVDKKWLRNFGYFAVIVLYLSSMAFSSFFSYVFLSNSAYFNIRPSDYNTELEMFLTENTRRVKEYNNAVYDLLLENIRETAPEFRELMDTYQTMASDKVQEIINGTSRYETDRIPDDARFIAADAYAAYADRPGNAPDPNLLSTCERMATEVNAYITAYNDQHYPKYTEFYNAFQSLGESYQADQITARQNEINNLIELLERNKAQLEVYGDNFVYSSVRDYIKSKCSRIVTQYDILASELNGLYNAYSEIANNPDVIEGGGMTLQDFYEALYSADISEDETLEAARENLQEIVSSYIKHNEDIDEENISSLVVCIEQLDKFNQSKALRERIESFEEKNLSKTYVIVKSPEADPKDGKTQDNSTSTPDQSGTGEEEQNESSPTGEEEQNESSPTGEEERNESSPTGEEERNESSPTGEEEQNESNPTSEEEQNESSPISEEEWKNLRHKDVTEFISLVKALPDVSQFFRGDENETDPSVELLLGMDSYISNTLREAYKYSREKLENISDMERAWNYLVNSDYRFLAVCCVIIALFLDAAAFLVGLYIYANKNEKKKPKSTVEPVSDDDSSTDGVNA